MRTRRTLMVLVVAAAIVGAYFGGRASVSPATPTTLTTFHLGSALTTTTNVKPVPATFDPVSVTFVSLATGWVLGTAPCSTNRSCLALRETTNAGRTWFARPLSTAILAAADRLVNGRDAVQYYDQLNVRFANTQDGWIYGSLPGPTPSAGVAFIEPVQYLWSTHDGGRVWRRQSFAWLGKYGALFDVEAANGTVYVMGDNTTNQVTVASSPVGDDSWRVANAEQLGLPAGGAQPSGSIVLNGSSGWLVVGNDRETSGAARLSNGRWVPWTPPCTTVGNSFATPAASSSAILVAVCTMGGFAQGLSPQAPRGAKLGSSWLYISHDGGNTFEAGPELSWLGNGYFGVVASPAPGVIFLSRPAGSAGALMASFDGGVHWNEVYRGQPLYLGFTSATQGVAIVPAPYGSNGANTMILTYDGGHHWTPVTF